jgi:phosphoesterase RecJ-like protein
MPDVAGDPGRIPLPCAESLYVGMMTDTNNFSNSVFPGTFEMASKLIARGVDTDGLQDKVLNCYSESRTRLMGHMIQDKMVVLPQYGAAYMLLSNREKDLYDFKPGDSEGFVNLPLAIRDVQVSALFTENFDGRYIRVSLRSKSPVNVNSLAVRFFNGGGHRNASGGRLYMPLEEVPACFEKALAAWTDEEKFS